MLIFAAHSLTDPDLTIFSVHVCTPKPDLPKLGLNDVGCTWFNFTSHSLHAIIYKLMFQCLLLALNSTRQAGIPHGVVSTAWCRDTASVTGSLFLLDVHFILKRMAADDILLNVVLQHHLFARLFMKFSVAVFLGVSKQLESDVTRWKPISWLNQACQSNQKHRRRETIRNLVTLLTPLSLFSSVAACTRLTSAGVYRVHYL